MGLVPTLTPFVPGTKIMASAVDAKFDAIVTVINGNIDDANVNEISAGKVTSGVFHLDRVPAIDNARLPVVDASKIPRLDETKLPRGDFGKFLKARGSNTDAAYETVQWGDLANRPTNLVEDDGVTTAKIKDKSVTNVKLRDSAAVSVIGRSTNSTGSPADIVAGSNNRVLKRKGDVLQFAQVEKDDIADGAVTAGKLASNSVTGGKIANEAVTHAKLGSDIVNATRTVLGQGAVVDNNVNYITALGDGAEVTADYCVALGSGAKATASYSIALGWGAQANGQRSTALGRGAQANGAGSTSLGWNATSNNTFPLVIHGGDFWLRYNTGNGKLEVSKDGANTWQTVNVTGW